MSERRPHLLQIERTFNAPAEDVFDAWTSEEVLRRWLYGSPELETSHAYVDLRVGGTVRIVMRNPEDGAEHGATGEYTVIDRPRRLEFTWIWDEDPENPQLIELEFTERDGMTTVVMVNSGISSEKRRGSQEEGWNVCFDNLVRELATGA